MLKIGLTGPTGAGKSTVAACFADAGLPIVDADAIAHETVVPGSPVLAALADAFGGSILLPDGSLDRAALADAAFSSPENTARLNAITHPAIICRIRETFTALERRHRAAVLDAPLLFESGLDAVCDYTIAVLAGEESRRSRIMARDGLSAEAACRRMQAQPPEDFYIARADRVLRNDAAPKQLRTAAAALLREIGGWSA